MKRSIINLIASALLLGLGWLVPHSPLIITLETPTPTLAPVFAAESSPTPLPASTAIPTPTIAPVFAAESSPMPLPTSTAIPTPARDPFGELYFTLVSFDRSPRLVRLPGACVVGHSDCPEPEWVQTPFDMKDVFTNVPKGLAWSRDGKFGVLVTHPEDELSRGRTKEELNQLKTQSPADFQVSTSTIYLFDAETGTWSELYHAERKFIYTPVWSADGQWLAFTVRSSVWAIHPLQAEDGVYVIHPDGSGLKQLAAVDATPLGWVGSSVAVQRTVSPYPAVDYAIEMLALDGQVTSLFASTRMAAYNLAPDGGALLVTDMQGENIGGPQKSVDLLALDGSITHPFGIYNNWTQSIWVTAWASDSSQIAFANLRRAYVAPRNGNPREVYLADDTYVEPSFWNMQFSPDQKSLLMDVYDGTPRLVVISLESGRSTVLTWKGMNSDEQPSNFSWRP